MRKPFVHSILIIGAAVCLSATAAAAQQTLNITVGGFVPHGEDARVRGDVLTANRSFLAFDLRDFNGATIGAEWLFPVGPILEGGAGVSFTRRTVPTVYLDYVDNRGGEIEQDLRLRRVPVDLTIRLTPLGHRSPVQPYIGAGLGLIAWRYSEFGDFVDFGHNLDVVPGQYVATGTAAGPVVLGGIRFAGDVAVGGFEVKYHKADGALDDRFLGSRIDVGGWTYQLTLGVRF